METQIIKTNEHNPNEMIMAAVTANTDLDKLKGLMELQFRWDADQARKAFHQAMTSFKANPIEIDKDKTVGYKTEKGPVGYTHASLANVVRTITKELSQHGLSASWRTDQQENKICVTCKITHVMGHSEETTLSAPADNSGSKNAIQAMGSTVTYLQRYTLLSITGLATSDQDDDAKAATEFINEWQIDDLRDLLKTKDLSEANLIKFMKVEKIEEIPAAEYKKAEEAIKSAKKKEAVGK